MQWQTLLPLLLVAVFGAYAVWMMLKRKKAVQNLGPAFRRFFEQTGYRFTEIRNAPLEEHVQLLEQKTRDLQGGTGSYSLDLVRDFHGVPVRYQMYMGAPQTSGSDAGWVMWCRWSMALDQAPRVLWEVADKKLASMGKAIKEAFTKTKRKWEPAYSQRIEVDDPELKGRFMVYGEDPEAVVVVLQNPALKQHLLDSTEVDLCVARNEVYFSDPFQKNLRAGMGGTLGAMATGLDYGKMMDLSIPVHDRITELLAVAMRASS
jgi:hypothetical protein